VFPEALRGWFDGTRKRTNCFSDFCVEALGGGDLIELQVFMRTQALHSMYELELFHPVNREPLLGTQLVELKAVYLEMRVSRKGEHADFWELADQRHSKLFANPNMPCT
jgi:hypothetical protein